MTSEILQGYMTGPLAVLALWQPHATLCVAPDPANDGKPPKTHETHAAKKNDADNRPYFTIPALVPPRSAAVQRGHPPRFAAALKRCGFYAGDPTPFLKRKMDFPGGLKPMPFGAIIGLARVTEISSPQSPIVSEAHAAGVVPLDMATLTEDDRWFGNYLPSPAIRDGKREIRYAWKLEDVVMLPEPIHHTGRQDALYPLDKWERDRIDAQLRTLEAQR